MRSLDEPRAPVVMLDKLYVLRTVCTAYTAISRLALQQRIVRRASSSRKRPGPWEQLQLSSQVLEGSTPKSQAPYWAGGSLEKKCSDVKNGHGEKVRSVWLDGAASRIEEYRFFGGNGW